MTASTLATNAPHPPKTSNRAQSEPPRGFAKGVWFLASTTANDWVDDKAPRLAAALAYYALLSLAPLIVLALAVAGFAFGDEAARGGLARELGGLVGNAGAEAVQGIVKNARAPAAGIVSGIAGVIVLLFGASGVFGELQAALNTIWEVSPRPGRGIKGVVRDRLFSFAMVMGVAFLLLVSLIVSAALSAAGRFMSGALPGGEALWQVVNFVFSLAVVTSLFAFLFKTVPDAKVAWRDVWIGALVTATLFTLGKFLIGLYLGTSTISSSYGAAGSLVLLVIWVYYSSSILLFGAEFTQVFASAFGSRIRPADNAIAAPRPEVQAGRPLSQTGGDY